MTAEIPNPFKGCRQKLEKLGIQIKEKLLCNFAYCSFSCILPPNWTFKKSKGSTIYFNENGVKKLKTSFYWHSCYIEFF